MQIPASKELSKFIKHFLFLESKGDTSGTFRLFSDGNTGLVYSLKGSLWFRSSNNSQKIHLPQSFIYGQISNYKDIYLSGDTSLIVVVFQPTGIHLLTGIPVNKLKDSFLNAVTVFGDAARLLEEKFPAKGENETYMHLLEKFFLEQLTCKTVTTEFPIYQALEYIKLHHGQVTMTQLGKFTGFTERHLERKFQECIGIAPKRYCNIIKLHACLKQLKLTVNKKKLTATAYAAGYADQSHLIREFRKHTGATPNAYLNKTRKLATNLVDFNS